MLPTRGSTNFSEAYKGELFILWWKNHKPSPKRLYRMIPVDWGENKPAEGTLRQWIKDSFEERAAVLDKQLANEIEGRLIQEKVEMLYRHGEIGRTMQNRALEKLETVEIEDLPTSAAVRLLVEGVRIERESVGLPQALEKMINSSDEDIMDRLESLMEEAPADILVIEDAESD